MNARSWRVALGMGPLVLGLLTLLTGAAEQPSADDVQDLVFLGESRPLLIRLHVQVDGKPVQDSWDAFLKSLFHYLDVNGDGVLDKAEAERAPLLDLIFASVTGRNPFAGKTPPTLEVLDADKDGIVTLGELDAYYRKNGYVPFHVQMAGPPPSQLGEIARLSGRRPEPGATAVGEAVFALLDTNKDGKLSREELTAAPAVLLRVDENEDEIVLPTELVPDAPPPAAKQEQMKAPPPKTEQTKAPPPKAEQTKTPLAKTEQTKTPAGKTEQMKKPDAKNEQMKGMMAPPGVAGSTAGNKTVVLLPAPGQAPPNLARLLQERYGPRSDKPEEKKLTCKELGLDAATFARLDANKDGVLDATELAGFVKRPADLDLTVCLGKGKNKAGVELTSGVTQQTPLAGKLKSSDGVVLLGLGLTHVDLRTTEEAQPFAFASIVRQQLLVLFKAADKDNNGYIDEKESASNPFFKSLFKAMDRDGDGKVYEREMIAYLDQYLEFQKQAMSGCVTLVLSDQNKGLFDLLDENRDGRLSVREMRCAPKLLEQFDPEGKGSLRKSDLPRNYQVVLRRGPVDTGTNNDAKAFAAIYGGSYFSEAPQGPTTGPLWFRKMDKNRDGDVSRKEFLGTDDEFRAIDTDGDGLISLEEAQQADARLRQK